MTFLETPRLGLVVPPENPTAEPELNRLVSPEMNVYTTRFPMLPGKSLEEMLRTYNRVLPDTLANFGHMRLDAVVVACSASHYLLSPEGDRRLCDQLTQRARLPVQSSTQAVLAACEALGLTRVTLVSPYEPWLTNISRGFWEEAGLTVDHIVPVPAGDRFDPYEVTTETILERVRGEAVPSDSALLFTGTGMSTMAALERIAAETEQVLLTSNLASAWWALRTLGSRNGKHSGHPLLGRLEEVEVV